MSATGRQRGYVGDREYGGRGVWGYGSEELITNNQLLAREDYD